ncbi:MBL fold metallo-hydrolase [Cephaloticoccus primus]|uniref:MBL fold metallo-hydrolase n=1 Tax=Cephaloticoccus primus TaxID=1548207 RepID=UPI0008398033|nr:MBL fold metallo-hydrolase [Cephaloticoccus primus]
MRFCILGSGSSGNSALLQTTHANVLIDAGLSARRLGLLLANHGLSLEQIDAIFLTHEHGDHCAGIDGLKKHPHIRLFANLPTARAIQAKLKHRPHWVHFETGACFHYRDLAITSFSVPHDAQEPVGFRIEVRPEGIASGDGATDSAPPATDPGTAPLAGNAQNTARSLVWLTDLGYAPPGLHQHLAQSDIIVVEANHCPELLKADTKRPWSLKQRIAGRHGHLSNHATAELLAATASPRWRHIYLIHLSRDCNSPEAVHAALGPLRAQLAPQGCGFTIAAPGEGTPLLDFGEMPHAAATAAPARAPSAERENARAAYAPQHAPLSPLTPVPALA